MKHLSDEKQRQVLRRLKLIEGQTRGLQRLIAGDVYCIDVITQTSAVKQGLSKVEDLLLESHLATCVLKPDELLKVYKLKRK